LPFSLERVDARGVYLIGHKQPGRFTREDIPLLEAVISQIGLAIENAMLFKNQSERSIQLSLINEVSQAATSILNLDVMLRTVVQAIREVLIFCVYPFIWPVAHW
jgi:GAF domain-containing protein